MTQQQSALDLRGKTALITGAGGGIGMAIAERFKNHGAELVLTDIRCNDAMAALDPVVLAPCDVSNEQQMCALFSDVSQQIGKIDILINNAGLTHLQGSIEEMSDDYFKQMQSVNVNGVFYGLKYGPRHMRDNGSIINTASLAASYTGPEYGAYSMTKAAVVSLTKTAAIELGARGIRVNAVCPGHTRVNRPGLSDEESQFIMYQAEVYSALGRIAEVDEQAAVFHFLAADESRYLTGQALVVDGGFSLGDTEKMYELLVQ